MQSGFESYLASALLASTKNMMQPWRSRKPQTPSGRQQRKQRRSEDCSEWRTEDDEDELIICLDEADEADYKLKMKLGSIKCFQSMPSHAFEMCCSSADAVPCNVVS